MVHAPGGLVRHLAWRNHRPHDHVTDCSTRRRRQIFVRLCLVWTILGGTVVQARRAKQRPSRGYPAARSSLRRLLVGGSRRRLAILARNADGDASAPDTRRGRHRVHRSPRPTTPRGHATPSSHTTADGHVERPRRPAAPRSRRWMTAGTGCEPRTGCWTRPSRGSPHWEAHVDAERKAEARHHLGAKQQAIFKRTRLAGPVGPAALRRRGQRLDDIEGSLRQGRRGRRQDQDRDGQVPEAQQGAEAGAGGR